MAKVGRPKGGSKTGGRKRGVRNKLSIAQLKAAAASLSPLEFLVDTMRDESQPLERRLAACIGALPYTAAKLAHIQQQHSGEVRLAGEVSIVWDDPSALRDKRRVE